MTWLAKLQGNLGLYCSGKILALSAMGDITHCTEELVTEHVMSARRQLATSIVLRQV